MIDKIPNWLPELICLETFNGDWNSYLDELYRIFKRDFVYSRPFYNNFPIRLKRHPIVNGKEATFWHLISSGVLETDRKINLRRCERIKWPKAVIEHTNDIRVKIWKNKRGSENRICLWLEDLDYIVILAMRSNYIILWTAYMIENDHTKRKLLKEYKEYSQNIV